MLPISYGDGNLTLTRTSSNKADDSIELGQNVKRGRIDQSNMDRFSHYIVKGTDGTDDNKSLLDFTQPHGQKTDGAIDRFRPIIILAEEQITTKDAENRANWEARVRAGKSRKLTYEVQGWEQLSGNLWEINSSVPVIDSFFSIDDTLLITDLTFLHDEQSGSIARISVIDKSAFELLNGDISIFTIFDPSVSSYSFLDIPQPEDSFVFSIKQAA
jgi:prophage tail gpP-like protein